MMTYQTRLCVLAALLWTSTAAGQQIEIKLTNKIGQARENLAVSYTVRGINVDDPESRPIFLFDDNARTSGEGILSIDVGRVVQALNARARQLRGSRQVEIALVPFSATESLSPLTVPFLLGSATQEMRLVMMVRPVALRVLEAIYVVYEGNQGTFHLTGDQGTAHYWADRRWLVRLQRYQMTDRHLIYREMEMPDKFWAFDRHCPFDGCGCCQREQCRVWIWDPGNVRAWRIFDLAQKVVPANADSFTSASMSQRYAATAGEYGDAEYRQWWDITGQYSRIARFTGLASDPQKVNLMLRDTGQVIAVPLDRLSENDRRYVAQRIQSMELPPPVD